MLARDLAQPFPVVGPDTNALDAARLLAERKLPGLIVLDSDGHPQTVLPGSQVLRFVLPGYVQEDPALARAYDERAADRLCGRLAEHPVRELLPRKRPELPVVDAGATAMEVAAVMARLHSPLVAVVDGGTLLGAITVAGLLDVLLPSA
ncbi:MAG: CBS domain-containing protein [Actinomycetota bacterium]|nr:CBS domain-containing protein [Actinomycetota bacterium]